MRERDRVPVEERVDDVGPDPPHGFLPARAGNLLDMPERHRADGVEAGAVGRPEPEEAMASLGEREHSLGVVRELPDEQDLQPVRLRRRRPLPKAPVERAFVEEIALGRSKAKRPVDLEVAAVHVDPAAQRFSDQLVPLDGVVDPLARDDAGAHDAPSPAQSRPEHRLEVVRDELLAFEPAIRRAAVHDLYELEAEPLDLSGRLRVAMVSCPRVSEDRVRLGVERGDERVEMTRVDDVVRRQIGDQACPGPLDPRVERGPEPAVRCEPQHPSAPTDERSSGDFRRPVGRAVIDHDQLPILEALREQAVERPLDECRRVVRGHDDAHPWASVRWISDGVIPPQKSSERSALGPAQAARRRVRPRRAGAPA